MDLGDPCRRDRLVEKLFVFCFVNVIAKFFELIQRQQSARDAYRAHLTLAASQPESARPTDVCALIQSPDGGAYAAHVDHLLYPAEQMLTVEEGWSTIFLNQLTSHTDYLCSTFVPYVPADEMFKLMDQFTSESCPAEPAC